MANKKKLQKRVRLARLAGVLDGWPRPAGKKWDNPRRHKSFDVRADQSAAAFEGSWVDAYRGSKVIAYEGSIIEAYDGAIIKHLGPAPSYD
jgi:hypothetical protein